jgi:hypothetical protein
MASFVSDEMARAPLLEARPSRRPNRARPEQNPVRSSLLPGIWKNIATMRNFDHFRLFEIGWTCVVSGRRRIWERPSTLRTMALQAYSS